MAIQGQVPGMTDIWVQGRMRKIRSTFFFKLNLFFKKKKYPLLWNFNCPVLLLSFSLCCCFFIFLFWWNKNTLSVFVLFHYAVYKIRKFWKYYFSLTVLPKITVLIFIKEMIALNQCCLIKRWKKFSLKSVLKKGTCDLSKLLNKIQSQM